MTHAEQRFDLVMLAYRAYGKADAAGELDRIVHEVVTRALTAQAWAVACSVVAMFSIEAANTNPYRYDTDEELGFDRGVECARNQALETIASLPAPADLAAEILGGEP